MHFASKLLFLTAFFTDGHVSCYFLMFAALDAPEHLGAAQLSSPIKAIAGDVNFGRGC
jgi:hypothetical protein